MREREHLHRHAAVDLRAVAQLADIVLSPAQADAVRPNRAAVIATGGDGCDARQAADRPRVETILVGTVADLSADVPAPAEHRAVRGQRAGVVAAGGDLAEA